MSMTSSQESAWRINAGYSPDQLGTLVIAFVFAILLVYGTWAIWTAYVGWCDQKITKKEFLMAVVRFFYAEYILQRREMMQAWADWLDEVEKYSLFNLISMDRGPLFC